MTITDLVDLITKIEKDEPLTQKEKSHLIAAMSTQITEQCSILR